MKTRSRQLCSLVGGEAQVGRRDVPAGRAARIPQRQTVRYCTHEKAVPAS